MIRSCAYVLSIHSYKSTPTPDQSVHPLLINPVRSTRRIIIVITKRAKERGMAHKGLIKSGAESHTHVTFFYSVIWWCLSGVVVWCTASSAVAVWMAVGSGGIKKSICFIPPANSTTLLQSSCHHHDQCTVTAAAAAVSSASSYRDREHRLATQPEQST